jgi:hypothetical protein
MVITPLNGDEPRYAQIGGPRLPRGATACDSRGKAWYEDLENPRHYEGAQAPSRVRLNERRRRGHGGYTEKWPGAKTKILRVTCS